jgi:hypothetical protein
MRSLEREIRNKLGSDADLPSYPGLQSPTYIDLTVSYTTVARGSRFGRLMTVFILVAVWVVFGGLTVFLSLNVSPPWQIAMAVFYGGGAALIFTDTVRVQLRGRSFFLRHVAATGRRRDESLRPRAEPGAKKGRSLWSYLLLPRPDDLVKALFVVAGIVVALISVPGRSSPRPGVAELVLFVVAVEWLVYQSRYQWNDIRGLYEDELSPSKADRQRLPGGTAGIPKSVTAMILRLIGVFWIAALAWNGEARISGTDRVMVVAIAMIYLVGTIYEEIRQAARRSRISSTTNLALTLIVVGLGYPIRFALGWWGGGGTTWSVALGLVLIAAWGLGILFVSLGWILEFADHIHSTDSSGDLYMVGPAIAAKPHLLTLAKMCGIKHVVSDQRGPVPVDGGDLRIIPRLSFAAATPWVVGSMIWYVCISASITELLGLAEANLLPWGIAAAVVLAAPLKYRGGLLPQLFAGFILTAGVFWNLGKAWLPAAQPIGGAASTAVLFAVSLLAVLLFVAFHLASYRSTRGAARKLVRLFVKAWQRFARWFIGSDRVPYRADDGGAQSRVETGPPGVSGAVGIRPRPEVHNTAEPAPREPTNSTPGG